jgi:tetratricopeptide (TPR) repeat protein
VEGMVSGHDRSISADLGSPVHDFSGTAQMATGHDGEALIPGLRTEGIDLDEIEEFDDDVAEIDDDDDEDLPNDRTNRPGVMLENPVEDSDVSTHYDLGLAYKEMGLFDDAIKAFDKVLRSRQREVQCRLMIGMCHRDQGNPSEAVHQFKQALHAPTLTELERQSLYYELGVSYELLGDNGEALYYLEMVAKRDSSFADSAERMARLKRAR